MKPEKILRRLIRYNTTNPPGNEKDCILWIKKILDEAGLDTIVVAKDPQRPNLIARLAGRGETLPILLYGHVDVVAAGEADWSVDPFAGEEKDGWVWGRGALDMKGGIAMMLSAILQLKTTGIKPAGDIIFAAVSDEEAGSEYGAGFLVSQHAEFFKGVRYAIGEFGGFPMYVGKKCFYLIQTGEKQRCWMKAKLTGSGGHGSQRHTGGTMAALGRIIRTFDRNRLPVHVTPIVRDMIQGMAKELPFYQNIILNGIIRPCLTDLILDRIGERGKLFDPLLHNTVNITMVSGGEKINVVPSEISFYIDGRILPGISTEQMIREIRQLAGDDFTIEIVQHDPSPPKPDMGLFSKLAGAVEKAHPGSKALPFLLPGVTDAAFFSKIGIQTYGFLPMNLPADFQFSRYIHAADERVPVASLHFGTDILSGVIRDTRF